MPRLVVVLPLSPLREGESFAVKNWPLHVTVLPPFLTEAAPRDVADAIAAVASRHPAIEAVAGLDDLFGRRHDVPVTLIDESAALTGLHHALVDAVRPLAVAPDEPAFTGSGFRAHVTIKPPRRVHDGDRLFLSQIALVDMVPRSAEAGRTVLSTIDLSP